MRSGSDSLLFFQFALSAEDAPKTLTWAVFPLLCCHLPLRQVLYHLHNPDEPWYIPKCSCGQSILVGKGFSCGTCADWSICEARLECLPFAVQ